MPASPSIAVCGLDCASECDIYRATFDPSVAQRLLEGFRAEGRTDAKLEWFHCDGCRGERSKCWSDDCWIWQCCAAEHKLEHCAQCAEFPCARLAKWAAGSARYARALERLKGMVAGR